MQDQQLQQAFFLISLTIEDIKKRLAVIEEKIAALENMALLYAKNQSDSISGSDSSPSNGDEERQ